MLEGSLFFSQSLLLSSATVSFKLWMSHILSISATTFLTAALLFFIFSMQLVLLTFLLE